MLVPDCEAQLSALSVQGSLAMLPLNGGAQCQDEDTKISVGVIYEIFRIDAGLIRYSWYLIDQSMLFLFI
jgi:hypothetical protein